MKLCKDCVHYQPYHQPISIADDELAFCVRSDYIRTAKGSAQISPVTGVPIKPVSETIYAGLLCHEERASHWLLKRLLFDYCGPEGRFFKPKP
jgi:hypothetical protein